MPGGSLGTIRGQIRLDVANAIAGYAAVRAANAHTMNTMNDARNRMRGFGIAAVGMGAAFLAGFGMAVNAAADFEKKLDYFGAVNNATAQEMEKVRAKALELGRTSAFSAGQIADAIVEMGKAGVSAKDITDGMADAMVNLASAADIDLAQATNIVTSQIQAYNLTAKDAVHVTDLMAGAANASIIDVTDIGVSMKYVAGVAHSLGITIDSTTDAISLLGKAGIKGSTAGTSLRQIMVSLAGGTKKAKGVLEDLGIITADGANKFFTAEGKAKSLGQVFQILQDHTANLSDKERIMAFRTIFNNRALAAASILTKEGAKGFREMNAEISKTTAADVAAKRMDNLAGDMKKLRGNIDTLLIQAGTPFQNFLRGIVQGLTKVVQFFASLPQSLQTGIMAFMLIAGVLLVVAGSIALMGAAFAGAIGTIRSVIGAFKAMWLVIKAVIIANRALAISALTNPYVLIALAVIALVAGLILLYKRSEKFREIMDAIGRGIKTGFMAAVEWFKGLPAFFGNLWKDISNWFKMGVEWVKQNWDLLLIVITGPVGVIIAVIRRFGDDIASFMSALPGRVVGYLATAWSAFVGFMQKLPFYIGYAIGFILGTLVKFGIAAGLAMWNAGKAIWDAIVYFFTELPGDIADLLVTAHQAFVRWGLNMVMAAQRTAVNTYNAIIKWFQQLPGRIQAFVVNTYNRAVSAWNNTVNAAQSFGVRAYNAIVNWFRQLPGRVGNFMVDLRNRAVGAWNSAVQSAKAFGVNAYNAIVNSLSGLPGRVWSILVNVKDQFMRMVSSAFNAAKQFASGLWEGFKDGLGIASPSYIEKAMFAISDTTAREGAKLKAQVRGMQSLARGLQTVHDSAAQAGASPTWAMKAAQDLKNQMNSGILPMSSQLGLQLSAALSDDRARRSEAGEGAGSERPITVIVHNPVAERASDSTARKLRQLTDMGAL